MYSRNVLVVDDDQLFGENLAELLNRDGSYAKWLPFLEVDIIDSLSGHTFDLAIINIRRDLTGKEGLLERLIINFTLSKIIVIADYGRPGVSDLMNSFGFPHTLYRPFRMRSLEDILVEHFEIGVGDEAGS